MPTFKLVTLPCDHVLLVAEDWPPADVTGECSCGTAYRALGLGDDVVVIGPPEVIEAKVRFEIDEHGVRRAFIETENEPVWTEYDEKRWSSGDSS